MTLLLVGLTGGIGSGKSEVTRRFAALGAQVVDADLVAREVVEPGTQGLADIAREFGDGVIRTDGSLDREALAAIVFADDAARARLNAITHPRILERSTQLIEAAAVRDPAAVVLHDMPLLVELGLMGEYDAVVVVAATPQTQVARLVALRGMTEADARARIAAQLPLADKIAVADYVIDNDGDLAALDAQVREVWAHLAERAGRTTTA